MGFSCFSSISKPFSHDDGAVDGDGSIVSVVGDEAVDDVDVGFVIGEAVEVEVEVEVERERKREREKGRE